MLDKKTLEDLSNRYQGRSKPIAQIKAVQELLSSLQKRQLPKKPLPRLLYSEKELMKDPSLLPLDSALGELRETIIKNYGLWFLPNQAFVRDLFEWLDGRPLVELAAGNAAITAGLQALGLQATAVDTLDWAGQDIEHATPWTEVQQSSAIQWVQNAIQSVKDGRENALPVFLVAWWPNGNPEDWFILKALRQSSLPFSLIVIGEKGPYTNSQRFWQQAILSQPEQLNRHYQPFDDFQDAIYLVQ